MDKAPPDRKLKPKPDRRLADCLLMVTLSAARAMGNDRIVMKGEKIFVNTRGAMPDWQVRKYRRIAVVWSGRTYFVDRMETIDRHTTRYALEPWPQTLNELPGRTIYYDEHYVRTRDRARALGRRREVESVILRALKPLIGFLSSRIKARIDAQWGISARSATFFSLWAEWFGFLAVGVANMINVYAYLHNAAIFTPGQVAVLFPVEAFLPLDLSVRYGNYLSAAQAPYGIGEWIYRHRDPRA